MLALTVWLVASVETVTGGTFDYFDAHCGGQNGLHNHFVHQRYSDGEGVERCGWTFRHTKPQQT